MADHTQGTDVSKAGSAAEASASSEVETSDTSPLSREELFTLAFELSVLAETSSVAGKYSWHAEVFDSNEKAVLTARVRELFRSHRHGERPLLQHLETHSGEEGLREKSASEAALDWLLSSGMVEIPDKASPTLADFVNGLTDIQKAEISSTSEFLSSKLTEIDARRTRISHLLSED